jgi:hypothetical protein
LDEQWPSAAAARDGQPEVTEIPGQDQRLTGFCHRHDHRVGKVNAGTRKALDDVERSGVLGKRRTVQLVRSLEKGSPEDQPCCRMPPCAEHEVHFDVDRPRDDDAPAERSQETGCELVPSPLTAIAC